ncbi:hypothetical protein LTS18_004761 [Coniosporium uncinatum]|uniref:Uncharacterized protein n=1 Tax=Coniosporium uncinatum TaxID=93489 RepID=A0ACC3DXQ5_9PEZI|nr:hypothetical protein LTS18_004761 [Coniosporium uncinatum]
MHRVLREETDEDVNLDPFEDDEDDEVEDEGMNSDDQGTPDSSPLNDDWIRKNLDAFVPSGQNPLPDQKLHCFDCFSRTLIEKTWHKDTDASDGTAKRREPHLVAAKVFKSILQTAAGQVSRGSFIRDLRTAFLAHGMNPRNDDNPSANWMLQGWCLRDAVRKDDDDNYHFLDEADRLKYQNFSSVLKTLYPDVSMEVLDKIDSELKKEADAAGNVSATAEALARADKFDLPANPCCSLKVTSLPDRRSLHLRLLV